MKLIAIIAITTIRKIIRDHTFFWYVCPLLLSTMILPLSIEGDGGPGTQIKVSITYTYGFIGIILTFTTLWLSCTTLIDEIETYQIHLIITKPVPRSLFWLGKLFGIVFLQGAMLTVASAMIYLSVLFKLHSSGYQEEKIKIVKNEILVGRKVFLPKPLDVDHVIEKELERQRQAGLIQENRNGKKTVSELRRDMLLRMSEVPINDEKRWEFNRLPKSAKTKLFYMRYRMYVDSTDSRGQRETEGIWWVLNPENSTFYPLVQKAFTGIFHELSIPSTMINNLGNLILKYENRDPQSKSVIFQPEDGPNLLFKETDFWQNLARATFLIFLQLIFIAILGCTAASLFSMPMAVFISSSYIVLGILVVLFNFITTVESHGQSTNLIYQAASIVRMITKSITVPLNEYYEIHRVVNGELIELSRILRVFIDLILFRGVPLGLLGTWLLSKRELGLVFKR